MKPLLVVLAMIAPLSGFSAGQVPPLGSRVFTWEELKVQPTPVGARREVADQPTATFERFESHISTLLPARVSHPPHQHAQEELIVLKEGHLAVHLNGCDVPLSAGSLCFFAANDWHAVHNDGDTPATYYVFNFQTAATKSAPARPASESASPDKLKSQIFAWEQLPVTPTPKGARREIADAPTVTCASLKIHATTLNVGEIPHAPHHHPVEEIILVKEGRLEATVNGRFLVASAGSILFIASNEEHGLRNLADGPTTYYVIRPLPVAAP